METASQRATFRKYKIHWPINMAVYIQAEKAFRNLGGEVKHNVRAVAVNNEFNLTGHFEIAPNDDTSLITSLTQA